MSGHSTENRLVMIILMMALAVGEPQPIVNTPSFTIQLIGFQE